MHCLPLEEGREGCGDTEAGPPRSRSGALFCMFLSHIGLGNCFLVFFRKPENYSAWATVFST